MRPHCSGFINRREAFQCMDTTEILRGKTLKWAAVISEEDFGREKAEVKMKGNKNHAKFEI